MDCSRAVLYAFILHPPDGNDRIVGVVHVERAAVDLPCDVALPAEQYPDRHVEPNVRHVVADLDHLSQLNARHVDFQGLGDAVNERPPVDVQL